MGLMKWWARISSILLTLIVIYFINNSYQAAASIFAETGETLPLASTLTFIGAGLGCIALFLIPLFYYGFKKEIKA